MNNAKLKIKLLKLADAHLEKSNIYFTRHTEENNDDELAQIYWTTCKYEDGIVKGLLIAYEELTSRCVSKYKIKEEIFKEEIISRRSKL